MASLAQPGLERCKTFNIKSRKFKTIYRIIKKSKHIFYWIKSNIYAKVWQKTKNEKGLWVWTEWEEMIVTFEEYL